MGVFFVAIIKRIKSNQYAQIHNNPLQNLEDIRAIGVLSHLMSLPDDWEIHKTQLYKKFGRAAITHGLSELENKGYFLSIQYREGKMNYYTYYISDVPFEPNEVQDILKELIEEVTHIMNVSSRYEDILSAVENQHLNTNSSQSASTKKHDTNKYKQKNINSFVNKKDTVNNFSPSFKNSIEELEDHSQLEQEFHQKGLSFSVIQRVREEVEANKNNVNNLKAYYRSCLENTLHKHRLKRNMIDQPYPHLPEKHPLNQNWLQDKI